MSFSLKERFLVQNYRGTETTVNVLSCIINASVRRC